MKRRHPKYAESIDAARHWAHVLEAQLAEAVELSVDEVVGALRDAWERGR
ncbi:MAG TPA: hypothetical protein VFV59_07980 [Candidatus Limnocylindria bacterium]|nr:hypothetical protein [Candidatus Limnocylindria bacterium]